MNPFNYYAEVPSIANEIGYEMQTTYWGDFRVGAELGGLKGIKDTYKRGLELAESEKVYGIEFSLVLNWLCWFYAGDKVVLDDNSLDTQKALLFKQLWEEFHAWVLKNWPKDWKIDYLRRVD